MENLLFARPMGLGRYEQSITNPSPLCQGTTLSDFGLQIAVCGLKKHIALFASAIGRDMLSREMRDAPTSPQLPHEILFLIPETGSKYTF
jgi:hypothetical protein